MQSLITRLSWQKALGVGEQGEIVSSFALQSLITRLSWQKALGVWERDGGGKVGDHFRDRLLPPLFIEDVQVRSLLNAGTAGNVGTRDVG